MRGLLEQLRNRRHQSPGRSGLRLCGYPGNDPGHIPSVAAAAREEQAVPPVAANLRAPRKRGAAASRRRSGSEMSTRSRRACGERELVPVFPDRVADLSHLDHDHIVGSREKSRVRERPVKPFGKADSGKAAPVRRFLRAHGDHVVPFAHLVYWNTSCVFSPDVDAFLGIRTHDERIEPARLESVVFRLEPRSAEPSGSARSYQRKKKNLLSRSPRR